MSTQVSDLYVTIDATKDPRPDLEKLIKPRKRGDVNDEAIPVDARDGKNRIQAWQVSQATLDAHPHWLGSRRVAYNGPEWGVNMKPEGDEVTTALARSTKRKGRKENGPKAKKVRIGARSKKAAEELDMALDGRELEEIFNVGSSSSASG